MKRSLVHPEAKNDWASIRQPEHITAVLDVMLIKLDDYFARFCAAPPSTEADLVAVLGNLGEVQTSSKNKQSDTRSWLLERWATGLKKHYDKEERKYKAMFSEQRMEKFRDGNPKNFKDRLKTDCPVIHRSLRSKAEEMQEWKESFARAKPQEMFDTFEEVLDFARPHVEAFENDLPETSLLPDTFAELAAFSDEPNLSLPGVIGAGIKSTVVYYLFPSHFHRAVRHSLFGFYFLSDMQAFGLPSGTNEFIMINDTDKRREQRGSEYNYKIDQNYWYPYDLFMFYSYWLFHKLECRSENYGVPLDPDFRFAYVFTFLHFVCECNDGSMQVMAGGYGHE
jgi:hypothetical protein